MRIGIFTETYAPYISGLVTSEIIKPNLNFSSKKSFKL